MSIVVFLIVIVIITMSTRCVSLEILTLLDYIHFDVYTVIYMNICWIFIFVLYSMTLNTAK